MANVARLSKQNTQKNYSKELLLPPNGAGISFLRKELSKPQKTFKVENSSILSRVKAFLPQLEEGNRELAERLQGTNGEELDIECVEEGNPCIQMDLAVVPLPGSDSDGDSDSSDESSDSGLTSLKLGIQTKTRAVGAIVEM